MNLNTRITGKLTLKDPFIIASSHWTSSEASFKRLALIKPAAVTLKTTSHKKGGDGNSIGKSRTKIELIDSYKNGFAWFTDGAPTYELWDIPTTARMSREAKKLMPDAKLGLSILQGEDYARIAGGLDLKLYKYVELNWKYSFREFPFEQAEQKLQEIKKDIEIFIKIFKTHQLFIKVSRESVLYLHSKTYIEILKILSEHEIGLVVANSLRTVVPGSRIKGANHRELREGVVIGEHLFVHTYSIIREIQDLCEARKIKIPPIIATGGIVDMPAIIDLLAIGVSGIQLCSALDNRGAQVLDQFRSQLNLLGGQSLSAGIKKLKKDDGLYREVINYVRNDEATIVRDTFKDLAALIPIIANALKEESLDGAGQPNLGVDSSVIIPAKLRFIKTNGNVLTWALSNRIVTQNKMEAIHFPTNKQLFETLASSKNFYDLAILPKSAFDYLIKNKKSIIKENIPQVICSIGKSTVEVCTAGTKIDKVKTLYHFTGNSASAALDELMQMAHQFENVPIYGSQLLPLLRFWDEESGVLAKAPLSKFYGLFPSKELKKKWERVWITEEDLFLVASSKFASKAIGRSVCPVIGEKMKIESRKIRLEPGAAAQEIVSLGFLDYCRDLLTPS